MSVRFRFRPTLRPLLAAIVAACSSLVAVPALAQARVEVSGFVPGMSYDRFIVKYRDGSAERSSPAAREQALTAAAERSPRGKAVGLSHLRRMAVGADVVRTRSRLDRVEAEALMRQIALDPDVEYVAIDRLNHADLTPNDPSYGQQWGYSGTYGIRANTAWDVTLGAGAVVAVLDTGITSHSDLAANVLPGYDFISDVFVANDGNGRDANPADPGDWVAANACGYPHSAANSSWHGTHVAGTVAAVTNNAKGGAGVAPAAKIVPVRVLGKCGGYDSDIADAIVWASGGTVPGVPANANPAEVINMSLGGEGACGSVLQNAINGAVGRGTTVVVAAGNSNVDASTQSPSSCGNVITVAATTSSGVRAGFSNHGAAVDIAAPGSGILSTLNAGATAPGVETYASYSGTSMAAPHVSGVVALMQAAAATPKTPAQVESLIKANVTPFASPQSPSIGPGIVNAGAVVDAVQPVMPPLPGMLIPGVTKTGLSASAGTWLTFRMSVPPGATNLSFTLSGSTGDADMYVKFGGPPSTTVFDCRPYKAAGYPETCRFATPQVGIYYVRVRAYSAFSGYSLVGNYATGTVQTYTNGTNSPILDHQTQLSPIVVSGRPGYAPASTPVTVNIVHTYIGDLRVDLVAPDGSVYNLHNRTGYGTENLNQTYNVNLSAEAISGTWKLRVTDAAIGDTGYLQNWSIRF